MEERHWQDQVSIPFLYCRKHQMAPPTFEAPGHILPIFSAGLITMWRESLKTNETQLQTHITDRRSLYVRSDDLVQSQGEDADRGRGGPEVNGAGAGDKLRFSKVRPAAVGGEEMEGGEDAEMAEMAEWGEEKGEETDVQKEERRERLWDADVKMNARLSSIEAFSNLAITKVRTRKCRCDCYGLLRW
jgi:hypothetical protein